MDLQQRFPKLKMDLSQKVAARIFFFFLTFITNGKKAEIKNPFQLKHQTLENRMKSTWMST